MLYSDFSIDLVLKQMAEIFNKKSTPNRICCVLLEAMEIIQQLRWAAVPPPNNPLILEELREMDGEPVWCAFSEGRDCNMIIQWHNSEFFRSFECGFLLAEEYGKSWQAYLRKPEET